MEELNENVEFLGLYNEEEERQKMMNSMRLDGYEEGIDSGKKERNIEIACNMKRKNIDLNIISEVTGLSKEEIENLK